MPAEPSAETELQTWVNVLAAIVAAVLVVASQIWVWWTAWVCFAGGTVPLLGWRVEPSLGLVFLTVVVVEPLLLTACYWIYMLIMMPLGLIFRRSAGPPEDWQP